MNRNPGNKPLILNGSNQKQLKSNSMNKLSNIILFYVFLLLISCHSQEKGISESERVGIFEQVWDHVNEHFYDPDFNGIDWDEKYGEYKNQIAGCSSDDSFFLLLNNMLFELNSSHCGVGLLSTLDEAVSPYIFSSGETGMDVRIIDNQIVVTNVLGNSPADTANIKTGYIIEKIDGLSLQEIEKMTAFKPPSNERNHKFHLTSKVLRHLYGKPETKVKIDYIDGNDQHHSATLIRIERQNGIILGGGLPPAFLNSESFFVSKDIGYLTFNAFNPADMEHVLNNLEEVRPSKGLIIDLRGNDGGSIEGMKLLLGRFISETKKYGTYINRNERNEDFIEPAGKKYQGKVAVLVDEMSISGAENMAGIVQQFNLGTVLGNQTPGQMLWGNGYLIHDSIALAVPIYKLEYPNGFNPENQGITPDIQVSLHQEDLLNGTDTQLEKAIEVLEVEIP
jgi:carboxyl-terminal processing protease